MKKIITSVLLFGGIATANAQTSMAPIVLSAAATSMAIQASNEAHRVANTVGLGVLTGKQIENCLIISAYYSEGDIVCVCLNKNKDEVYDKRVRKIKGDFSRGVFNELRKSFNKKDEE